MTLSKPMKKVKCCGCFAWLFARRVHHSPSEDLDSTVEEIKNVGAEDDAGEQGQGSSSLVCLQNAAQPSVVEEEPPSDTQDADGVVGKGEIEANSTKPPTLTIIVHMVKRERVNTPLDEATPAEKDCTTKESHGKSVETLIITLHMVKKEKMREVCEELPSEHRDTAGDAQPHEGVKEELSFEQDQGVVSEAVNEPAEKTPLKSCFKKKDAPPNPAEKIVRFNFQNLNCFVKDRELYCGYYYFKYGFPLSSIRSELQELKERTVKAAPLQVTQSPNFTSRLHQQPVRSASNSLRGAPRHLGGRATQRNNDSFQHNSGRNAAHTYTNSRHSQNRQHNSSGHVSPRYETRYFYEAQTHPGTNSRSRRRVKRGAKPSDCDVLGEPGEYTAS